MSKEVHNLYPNPGGVELRVILRIFIFLVSLPYNLIGLSI